PQAANPEPRGEAARRLTQSPAPTTADFDVSGTDGSCPTVRLSGSFTNSNQFDATWMASCSGFCGSQTNMIFGERR
ncbi:MAG TPA: hypothetical protein RMI62_22825, partial [Polyangiaceae bacterium LLY-WYZ-15_(1-7)]|nr:hypothetical protein [Polyangiaceae bacterium LLY-WYZ-15_(1-7)]